MSRCKFCKICNEHIPLYEWINGQRKNLSGRSRCLECSPFNLHNSKKISLNADENCNECGRKVSSSRKGTKCHYCYYKRRKKRMLDEIYGNIVGESCWKCGYCKGEAGRPILEFHHIRREDKLFELSFRELINFSWDKVWIEMRKCALLCCRCHREVERQIIDPLEIIEIYKEKWKEIDKIFTSPDIRVKKIKRYKLCSSCGKEVDIQVKNFCLKCFRLSRRKVKDRPSVSELKALLEKNSVCAVGRMYGVSDNAIRKWLLTPETDACIL